MARMFTVRVWIECQALAETPEEAEQIALERTVQLVAPPRPHEWQAAAFGSRPVSREEEETLFIPRSMPGRHK